MDFYADETVYNMLQNTAETQVMHATAGQPKAGKGVYKEHVLIWTLCDLQNLLVGCGLSFSCFALVFRFVCFVCLGFLITLTGKNKLTLNSK